MGPGPGLVLGLLLGTLGWAASERHSLQYFFVATLEPSPGVPQFQIVGYLDGHPVLRYDSEMGEMVPRVDWLAPAALGQEHWDERSRIAEGFQKCYNTQLDNLRHRYNRSRTDHMLQITTSCDLLEDNSTRGVYRYAYNGRDFLAFDTDTMTFTASDWRAEITKREWEDGDKAQRVKHDLENTCIETLKKYVSYGRAALERKEPPTVRVSGREDADGTLTLSCRAYGFYPRRIAVSWLKDGDNRDHETWRGSVAPNSDGTFYTWASIEARPQEKDKYRCRVEHAGLPEPGLFAWEPESNPLGIVLGVVVAVLFVTVVAGVVWKLQKGKKKEKGYKPALIPS